MDTVLIADDERDMLLMLETVIRDEGFDVLTAHDGAEALAAIKEHHAKISTIILDRKMPKLGGIEVMNWMRENMHTEHIPIIMHTGMATPEEIREGIEAGAFYYLTKSMDNTLLLSILRTAVSDYNYKRTLLQQLKESENPFRHLVEGQFRFRTLEEGEYLALRIAQACSLPDMAVAISEIFINAIEHGNLAITYDEKTEFLADGSWRSVVERRLASPQYAKTHVDITVRRTPEHVTILVRDCGDGFDFKKYLKLDESRVFDTHGRGIAIAKSYLELQFIDNGSTVLITIPLIH